MTQTTDVRDKAAAILSDHKLRQLEAAGLTVVDKQRLEALERVVQAADAWKDALDLLIDIAECTEPDGSNCRYSGNAALEAEDAFTRAEHALKRELEAMEK